ncbi:hypothetical protein [Pseudomonas sp. 8Z]|uniref:hypothetical protein n=1 Tax=Pseudomonas sp. 8Z TaxID=2653166 RepID=UPI00135B206B|nr:hypothetical protein [Pseudomonas sp. 8Z]
MSFNYYQSELIALRQPSKRFAERSPVNNSVSRFFQISIWTPAALLLSLPFLEVWSRGKGSLEDVLVTFGLWFGALAYLTFAVWASCYIKKKSESAIVRLAWFAPLVFIPFYGIPWVAYGLFHVAMGDVSGFAMAVLWVAFSPCIVIAGYVFVALTLVVYEVFLKSANSGRER